MPDLPSPVAARLQRARWLDSRLLVGALLVLVPVVVGARVVGGADDTTPVWALTRDLGTGSQLGAEDLARHDVRLGSGLGRYVAADGEPPVGYVLTRAVGRDELLPRNAVRTDEDAALRRLAVEVDAVTAAGLVRGAVVDVYVVPEAAPGGKEPPTSEEVLAGVTVDGTDDRRSGLGSGGARTAGVLLLVTAEEARAVLDAQSRGTLRLLVVRAFAAPDGGS